MQILTNQLAPISSYVLQEVFYNHMFRTRYSVKFLKPVNMSLFTGPKPLKKTQRKK